MKRRLLKSFFVKPEGWPEGSSVLKSTLASWKYLQLSPKFWTSELFEKIQSRGKGKDIYRITSVKEINNFPNNFAMLIFAYNYAINADSVKRRSFVSPLYTADYGERWAAS